ILILLFASYIIMIALKPAVLWMQKRKIPRIAAIAISYISVLLLLILLIFPLVPFFAEQINNLVINFPIFLNNAAGAFGLEIDQTGFAQIFPTEGIGQNVFAFAGGLFGGIFSVIAAFVISIY